MRSIIVGTAGHIDHGKTALVKALTGIDADRLHEEKRRGITIDLGFAHMDLPGANGETLRIGFVDVPGHERFVRNMLAGVGGIDLVLLVIAADEAIKPQTREHLDILQLLDVRHGITVLTKSDAVDADTLEVVRLEAEDFLRGAFLESPKAPIVAVSSLTGAGLPELKEAMINIAAQLRPRDAHALIRLPIDRVFTMKGFGTVVTGTLVGGTVRHEEELEVLPFGKRVRVRGIQVHGQKADVALAGQRTALNLVGIATEGLSRGMTFASPGILETTRRADVSLQMLASAPHPLKDGASVHFHSHTMEAVAGIHLYETKKVSPGEWALARLKFPRATLLLPGDRFIVRQFSPVLTIGGGIVLDAPAGPRIQKQPDFLRILLNADEETALSARIARRGLDGASISRLVAETGRPNKVIEIQLAALCKGGTIARTGDLFLDKASLDALRLRVIAAISDFHKKNPLVAGISKEELRGQVGATPAAFEPVVEMLKNERKIEIAGDVARLPGYGVVLKDEEAESKKTIENAFASAGLKVPALQVVLSGLRIDSVRSQKIVTLLLRDRALIKISDQLVFHYTALEGLRRQMALHKAKSPTIDVTQFKELTGVSRKYAIPLLEYLDRERVTKRVGDARTIL
jgi:selenocysteine-specific elongation factor